MSQAQVVPFRQPFSVVFERFDPDDMSAMFKSKRGSDTYHLTLSAEGALLNATIEHADKRTTSFGGDTQHEHMVRLLRVARGLLETELDTWAGLAPVERISVLIHWAEEALCDLEAGIKAAVAEGPRQHMFEIADMYEEVRMQETYLATLKTARSLF